MVVSPTDSQLPKRARQFALEAHGTQRYGKDPYIVHPDDAVRILIEFGFADNFELLAAGYLHDTVGDTPVTASELEREFNVSIATWVWNVTGEGFNRKQRNASVYQKAPGIEESVILKLADRISNTRRSMAEKSSQSAMYRKEYGEFRTALYREEHMRASEMWAYLDGLSGYVA